MDNIDKEDRSDEEFESPEEEVDPRIQVLVPYHVFLMCMKGVI